MAETESIQPTSHDVKVSKGEMEMVAYEMSKAYGRALKFYKRKNYSPEEIDEGMRPGTLEFIERLKNETPCNLISWGDLNRVMEADENEAAELWMGIRKVAKEWLEDGARAGTINQRTPWECAQFGEVRNSFIDDWQPRGGVERAMIDMLALSYSGYLHWMAVVYSVTEYEDMAEEINQKSEENMHWRPIRLTRAEMLERAMQMMERFNRIFLRTLRQMRDLRRYSVPVTINNPRQVNIAADGGQQVNALKVED